jgi:hypothetical protein
MHELEGTQAIDHYRVTMAVPHTFEAKATEASSEFSITRGLQKCIDLAKH